MTRAEKIEALQRIEAGESVIECLFDTEKIHKDFLATVDFDILIKASETKDLTEVHLLFNEYVKNLKNKIA